MFLGEKIRKKRLNLNITQSELADGICTQFTISNLERKNLPPSTEILTQLCLKLNMDLNELFTEFDSIPNPIKITDDVTTAEHELLEGNFDPAKKILQKFDLEDAKTRVPAILYLWRSYIEIIENNNTDLAIFYSTQFSQNSSSEDIFETILFDTVMGIIYDAESDNESLASFYFDKSYQLLIDVAEIKSEHLPRLLFSIIKVVKFYLNHNQAEQAQKLLNLAISWSRQTVLVHYMVEVLELKLQNTKKGADDYEFVTSALTTFKQLAE
ncbi:helix-turn-helix transcriptional regulator [Lactobacillus sp. YT155]|uniref:helix-turn-helix domain-containing protein n=1 Tax=Lactobacillus sp. YT155 TaxID=3060955 RepID=UPI00265D9C07|nr:helix-turn-helix transcriptional regulator [Lactobacillus sp. YT155]MDO1604824.1 helix-turn-helix transcriptional regulator [Lactobacillus sp. YT155]